MGDGMHTVERFELVIPGSGLARRHAVHAGRPSNPAADAAIHHRRAVAVTTVFLLVCSCSAISAMRLGGVSRVIALILAGETGLISLFSSVLGHKFRKSNG